MKREVKENVKDEDTKKREMIRKGRKGKTRWNRE